MSLDGSFGSSLSRRIGGSMESATKSCALGLG
jgi:hypothetical protein